MIWSKIELKRYRIEFSNNKNVSITAILFDKENFDKLKFNHN